MEKNLLYHSFLVAVGLVELFSFLGKLKKVKPFLGVT